MKQPGWCFCLTKDIFCTNQTKSAATSVTSTRRGAASSRVVCPGRTGAPRTAAVGDDASSGETATGVSFLFLFLSADISVFWRCPFLKTLTTAPTFRNLSRLRVNRTFPWCQNLRTVLLVSGKPRFPVHVLRLSRLTRFVSPQSKRALVLFSVARISSAI